MPVVNDSNALQSGISWYGVESSGGSRLIVTFSFPTSAPDYLNGVDGFTAATVDSFQAFDVAQQAQARAALAEYAALGRYEFIEVPAGQADINFQIVDLSTSSYDNEGGLAFLPSGDQREVPSYNGQTYQYFSSSLNAGGDVFMNAGGIDGGTLNYGTLLHQIGRALGLKEPTEIIDNGRDVHDEVLSSDDFSLTVMASEGNGLPEGDVHLRPLDIDAVSSGSSVAGAVHVGDASGSNWQFSWSWDADTQTLTQTIDSLLGVRGSTVTDVIGPLDRFTGRMIISGLEGDDRLTGSNYNDILDGGAGADIMTGGLGDDIYYVEDVGDLVIEDPVNISDYQFDTVISTIDYTLPANVEALQLVGDNLTGVGNSGNNRLYADLTHPSTLIGGLGNDIYYIYKAADRIFEYAAEGNDTVVSPISFDIGALSIQTVQLTGSDDIDATGSAQANTLIGNGGHNTLIGLGGDDILDGKGGIDLMIGGGGDDTYYVDDSADQVIETQGASQGSDTVYSSVTFDLAGQFIEILRLTGTEDIDAYGNSQRNRLYGNDGNNILDGRGGDDYMAGGRGDDIYYVDDAGDYVEEQPGSYNGNDTVRATITYDLSGKYLENLELLGTGNLNAYGNSLSNVLTGNSGDNILNGREGRDTMAGGSGDDTYYVDNPYDVVIELQGAAQGNDTVNASVSFSLFNTFVETLALTGADNIDATGNAQTNTLIGNSGNNILDGRAGGDTMTGGRGDDTYYVDDALDVVIELQGAAQGNDTVYASVSYSLFNTFVETLTLTGTDDIDATGNAQANTLIGNAGDNVLTGRAGGDTFVFTSDFGSDRIADFDTADDLIRFGAGTFTSYDQVIDHASQVGSDVVISLDADNSLTLQGVALIALDADHFLFG